MSETAARSSGLFHPKPRHLVIRDLLQRSRHRLDGLGDAALQALLEDAVFHERKRLRRAQPDPTHEARLDALARSVVRGSREDWLRDALPLVGSWADEIHGTFNPRVYATATRALPRMLNGLLAGRRGGGRGWAGDQGSRVRIEGDTRLLRELATESTLILAPTHVSNLDSPLIGLALYESGLPPFIYGAGLNLFSSSLLGFWMHRLGAYTVDRLKRAQLYKSVLKDYSIRALTHHHHSLFFPGGTRARDGGLETKLKKGLLGTGLAAWQENLREHKPNGEIYVVPLTLSFQLVLEANTLVEDHLAEAGRQRYIISDDEFAQPRRLLAFARRVLDLEASVVVHFGTPLDCLGREVSGHAAERQEQARHRKRYVCNREGQVESDPQRDRVYTDRLAEALVDAYPRGAWPMVTHVVARAAWKMLQEALATQDTFRILRAPVERRQFSRHEFLQTLRGVIDQVHEGAATGRWNCDLPPTANAVLDLALDRYGRYHRSRVLRARGNTLVVEDPRLCLYYQNRVTFIDEERSP